MVYKMSVVQRTLIWNEQQTIIDRTRKKWIDKKIEAASLEDKWKKNCLKCFERVHRCERSKHRLRQ